MAVHGKPAQEAKKLQRLRVQEVDDGNLEPQGPHVKAEMMEGQPPSDQVASAPSKTPDARAPSKIPDARTPSKIPDARAPCQIPDARTPPKNPDAIMPSLCSTPDQWAPSLCSTPDQWSLAVTSDPYALPSTPSPAHAGAPCRDLCKILIAGLVVSQIKFTR